MRHKTTLNFWALLRPWCLLFGHTWHDVMPGDSWSRYHRTCGRCLLENYPVLHFGMSVGTSPDGTEVHCQCGWGTHLAVRDERAGRMEWLSHKIASEAAVHGKGDA